MQYFGFDRPSFGIKTFGFGESGPKLQADFTTGTYNSNGITKTFADLFAFTRAGKAWLVKDTGLQEYAADVPRLDNGLLIEKEATNIATWALEPSRWFGSAFTYNYSNNIDGNNTAVLATGARVVTATSVLTATSSEMSLLIYTGLNRQVDGDLYMLRNNTDKINIGTYRSKGTDSDFEYVKKISDDNYALFGSWSSKFKTGDELAMYFGGTGSIFELTFKWYARQITSSTIMSSMIPTTTTPVTRPADFLLNKITGTTVTGDWDSTLTLSIVAGNLVHSGYGRIRSLEIN